MTNHETLKKCPLFSGLDNSQLEQVEKIAHKKNYSKGETLFSEGQIAGGFYLLLEGKIKLYKLSSQAQEHILHFVSPGEPFAEIALFAGEARFPAYAEALIPSKLLYFPKNSFLELIKNHPQLSLNMLAAMSQILRRLNKKIEELALKSVPARLAQYLLQEIPNHSQAANPCVTLPLTKSQLASQLGTISETLSRAFKRFKEEGIIEVDGKVITILDIEALKDFCDFPQ